MRRRGARPEDLHRRRVSASSSTIRRTSCRPTISSRTISTAAPGASAIPPMSARARRSSASPCRPCTPRTLAATARPAPNCASAASRDPDVVASCLTYGMNSGDNVESATRTIGGVAFTEVPDNGDGGMQQRISSDDLRAVHEGACYAIDLVAIRRRHQHQAAALHAGADRQPSRHPVDDRVSPVGRRTHPEVPGRDGQRGAINRATPVFAGRGRRPGDIGVHRGSRTATRGVVEVIVRRHDRASMSSPDDTGKLDVAARRHGRKSGSYDAAKPNPVAPRVPPSSPRTGRQASLAGMAVLRFRTWRRGAPVRSARRNGPVER